MSARDLTFHGTSSCLAFGIGAVTSYKELARYSDLRQLRYDESLFFVSPLLIELLCATRKNNQEFSTRLAVARPADPNEFGVYNASSWARPSLGEATSCHTSTRSAWCIGSAPWSTATTSASCARASSPPRARLKAKIFSMRGNRLGRARAPHLHAGKYGGKMRAAIALDTSRVALGRLGLFEDYVRVVLGAVSIWGACSSPRGHVAQDTTP